MKNLSAALLLIALVAALVGCGNREKQLIGKWTGKANLPDSAKSNPMAAALASNIALELKEDKTFSMMMFEGTWSVSGDTLNLKTNKFMGMTMDQIKGMAKGQPGADQIDKPMQFSISSDGKTLTAIKSGGALSAGPAGQGDLTFTKSSS